MYQDLGTLYLILNKYKYFHIPNEIYLTNILSDSDISYTIEDLMGQMKIRLNEKNQRSWKAASSPA